MTRTRRLLFDALLDLLRERDYDTITVQQILDRADVGRSTFYAHFRNKDHLLLGDFAHGDFGPAEPPGPLFPGPIDLLGHLEESYDLYRAMVGTRAVPAVLDALRVRFLSAWTERLDRRPAAVRAEVPTAVAARYLTGATVDLIAWWLAARMPLPAERMNRLLDRLTAAALGTPQSTENS